MALDVEVMYNEPDETNSGAYLQRRRSLDAAHTLPRKNALFVILSRSTTSARSRRTVAADTDSPKKWSVTGDVERAGEWALWGVSSKARDFVGFIIVRGGYVWLGSLDDLEYSWVRVDSPEDPAVVTGVSPDLPLGVVTFEGPIILPSGSSLDRISTQADGSMH